MSSVARIALSVITRGRNWWVNAAKNADTHPRGGVAWRRPASGTTVSEEGSMSEDTRNSWGMEFTNAGRRGPRLGRFVLRRPGLVDGLQAASDAQLMILRGSSGIGKSTLLADWIEARSRREYRDTWVSVDKTMGSRSRFWQAVFERLSESGRRGKADSQHEDPREELSSRIGAELMLVLDDFQNAVDPEIAADLAWVLRREPQLKIVVASRSKSGLETPSVLAQIDTQIVDMKSLMFSAAESAAVLTLRGVSFDMTVAARVHARFGGWPAAINLVAIHMAMEDRRMWREQDLSHVLSNVEAELDGNLFADVARSQLWPVFLRGSLLPYLSTELLTTIVECSPAESVALLKLAESAGFGQWRRFLGEDRFYLAPLVRRLLLPRLNSEDSHEIGCLRRRIIQTLEEAGQPAEALVQAVTLEDWPLVSSITRRHYAVLSSRHSRQLKELLDRLPRDVLSADSWLLLLSGSVVYSGDGARSSAATALFAHADTTARESLTNADSLERARLSMIRATALRRLGSFSRSVSATEKSLAAYEALSGLVRSRESKDFSEACTQAGTTFLQVGMYAQALSNFGEAYRSSASAPHLRIQTAGYISLIRVLRGEIPSAVQWRNKAMSDEEWHDWRHSMWSIPAYLASALLAVEQFDTERATRYLQRVSRIGLDVEDWPLVAYTAGIINLVDGNGYGGFSAIRDFEGRHSGDSVSSHFQGILTVVKSDLLLLGKQARPALAALRPFIDGRESVIGANARALLFSGNDARAVIFAEQWAWKENASPRTRMELQLVKAVGSARLGDDQSASRAIKQALTLSETSGLRLPWSLVPRDELLNAAGAVDNADAVIRAAARVFAGSLTVPSLTRRESLVMSRLQTRSSLEMIARELSVSPNTVKSQVRSIYRKLGVSSRSDAVRVAFEWRLLGSNENPMPGTAVSA
jgi:LuxR family maltose regulon positive regulatory protein